MAEQQINNFKGNLFSPLASPNRIVYYQALVILYEMVTENEQITILRDDYADRIREMLAESVFLDEEGEEKDPTSAIIRKLRDSGWFYTESDESFREIITPYAYSTIIMEGIIRAGKPEKRHFSARLYNTYSTLKVAIESDDENDQKQRYNAVIAAEENIRRLKGELRSLFHEIGGYTQDISSVENVNDMLRHYWEDYKQVVDEHYYPIRMEDNLYHYIRPISALIQKIRDDAELQNQLIEQGMKEENTDSEEEIRDRILQAINYISDELEGTRHEVSQISAKHASLISRATNKIAYLMKADADVEGKLTSVLTGRKSLPEEDKAAYLGLLQEACAPTKIGYLGPQSLFTPRQKRAVINFEEKPVQKIRRNQVGRERLSAELGKKRYSIRETRAYLDRLMAGRERVSTAEVNPKSDEDLMDLICLSGYQNKFPEEIRKTGNAENEAYLWPELIITKKTAHAKTGSGKENDEPSE